jgi:hypothetical protein
MFDATPLLRLYARWRNSFLQSHSPVDLQRTQLLSLLRKAANTRFGKQYNFSSINSVEEYQRRVPLRTYEQFWNEYWKDSFPKLQDCTWPGIIPFFPVSSGTSSGTTKYIPCSHEMMASNTKAGMDLLVHHVTNCPESRILGGKSFVLGGSTDLTSPAPGIYFGDLSGIVTKQVVDPLALLSASKDGFSKKLGRESRPTRSRLTERRYSNDLRCAGVDADLL